MLHRGVDTLSQKLPDFCLEKRTKPGGRVVGSEKGEAPAMSQVAMCDEAIRGIGVCFLSNPRHN